MPKQNVITTGYFSEYRKKLGFTNQKSARDFLAAKDIIPAVDFDYVNLLNKRLHEITDKVNEVVSSEARVDDMLSFKKEYIDRSFAIMKKSGILLILRNQGRRPEQVYFSWMRGYVVANYFLKALGFVFGVDASKIDLIGDDELSSLETFKRTPKADLEIKSKEKVRLEIQSGFTGVNDIKQHKVLEAKRVFRENSIRTIAVHFDLYNGQAAFIKLDEIEDDDEHWINRLYAEEGILFNIDQNFFVWNLNSTPPSYQQITERYYA